MTNKKFEVIVTHRMKTSVEASDGTIIEVLPVGTVVEHKRHPELIGRIVRYEYHESGQLSPLPYCVHWDDHTKAAELLGWLCIYPCCSEVEEVTSGPD